MERQAVKFLEAGRWRRGEKIACKRCGVEFVRRLNTVRGEKRAFCSRQCSGAFRSTACEIEGALCHKKVKRSPSKLKTSRHGFLFCGRLCKEKAQSLGGVFASMQPKHYGSGDGKSSYRELAFKHLDIKCKDCGISFWPILTVHHKDKNRKNNDISNLEVLCWNHHFIRHMKKKVIDGEEIWVRSNHALTSEEDILTLLDFMKMGS